MTRDLHKLLANTAVELCTFGNGAVSEFYSFLDSLTDPIQNRLMCCLNELTSNRAHNPEVFRTVGGSVGLRTVTISGVYVVYFMTQKQAVICSYGVGRITDEAIATAKISQSEYFAQLQIPYEQPTNPIRKSAY